jgi:hypothetical protein
LAILVRLSPGLTSYTIVFVAEEDAARRDAEEPASVAGAVEAVAGVAGVLDAELEVDVVEARADGRGGGERRAGGTDVGTGLTLLGGGVGGV